MPVNYRLMRADEEPAVLALVCEAFQLPDLAYQAARFATDPAAHAHTFVADTPDRGIVSTLHFRVTLRCDATGTARLVGELDSVATRPDARRQGHATQLLLVALEALRTAGCDWSLLLASGEESRMLYERYGWRCYGESWRRGTLCGAIPQQDGRYLSPSL